MKKILLLILALIFCLTLISCGDSEPGAPSSSLGSGNTDNGAETQIAEIVLDENASMGYLSGKLTVDNSEKTYDIYFGNNDGQLEGYTRLGTVKGEFALDGVVVPPEATTVILVNGQETHEAKIPEKCLLFGKDAYIFGALADVHYNRFYSDGETDDALFAFDNALDYFDKIGLKQVKVSQNIGG